MPTDGTTHPLSLFMEDTGWPYAALDDYIRSWDEIYYRPLSKTSQILDIQGRRPAAEQLCVSRQLALYRTVTDVTGGAVGWCR